MQNVYIAIIVAVSLLTVAIVFRKRLSSLTVKFHSLTATLRAQPHRSSEDPDKRQPGRFHVINSTISKTTFDDATAPDLFVKDSKVKHVRWNIKGRKR